ncbi:TPA: fimbrial protein [Citrobacter werkmanii]|nr:fimbrial protein [Citrobacter werkmanii]
MKAMKHFFIIVVVFWCNAALSNCSIADEGMRLTMPSIRVPASMPKGTFIGEYEVLKGMKIPCDYSGYRVYYRWYWTIGDPNPGEDQSKEIKNSNINGIGYRLRIKESSVYGTKEGFANMYGIRKTFWNGEATVDVILELYKTVDGLTGSGVISNIGLDVGYTYEGSRTAYLRRAMTFNPSGSIIPVEATCNLQIRNPVFSSVSYSDIVSGNSNSATGTVDIQCDNMPAGTSLKLKDNGSIGAVLPDGVLSSNNNRIGFQVKFGDGSTNVSGLMGNQVIFEKNYPFTVSTQTGRIPFEFTPILLSSSGDMPYGRVKSTMGIEITYY